jgi:cation diffusion facilitator family transporter
MTADGQSPAEMASPERHRKSLLAVNLGLAANTLLAALKVSIGILGRSPALLADGVNSTSDVAYYVVVSVFMRLAGKPPDTRHPLGHSQLESIAAVVVGSFVVTTAVAIFWGAVNQVFDLVTGQGGTAAAPIALWVALFTIVVKLALTLFTQRLGRETRNAAVMALAYDHRNDVLSATAAAVGIALGLMGYLWADPLAGALVALVILRTGIKILADSSAELMDAVPSQALAGQVAEVLRPVPGVVAVEQVFAHRFGPYLVINLTIGIDGALSVAAGDAISTQVERALFGQIEFLRQVHVHYHPARGGTER